MKESLAGFVAVVMGVLRLAVAEKYCHLKFALLTRTTSPPRVIILNPLLEKKYKMSSFLSSPIFKALVGLVIFYIGLKTFAGGIKSMGKPESLETFVSNPYWMFVGGIVCTLIWQSSSLSTTTIVALVSGGILPLPSAVAAVLGANVGTTGTIWLASFFVSDGIPTGATRHIALIHSGVNMLMALALLPFVNQISRLAGRF